MSYAYTQEPPTSGKVVMHTTMGDLEIELWSKEAPKTCRNFIQLCLEGYYDGSILHRIVKNFIVQGGDPNGTGEGGESIYGLPFADEFHSRLRYTRRGLMGMANTGPNSNTSQFFFTLDRTEELNRKNSLFGKVVGETLYNLLKVGELDVDDNEKPLFPPKITSVDVLWNPFDDMVPRITADEKRQRLQHQAKVAAAAALIKESRPTKKNLAVLSFANDDQDNNDTPATNKVKSLHDVSENDPRLRRDTAGLENIINSKSDIVSTTHNAKKRDGDEVKEKDNARNGRHEDSGADEDSDDSDAGPSHRGKKSKTFHSSEYSKSLLPSESAKMDVRDKIQQLRSDIRNIGKGPSSTTPSTTTSIKSASLVDQMRSQYMSSAKVRSAIPKAAAGKKDLDALSKLKAFEQKLLSASKDSRNKGDSSKNRKSEEKEWLCHLHGVKKCKSCRDWDGSEEEDDSDDAVDWANTAFVATKTSANVYEPKVDDYEVLDPRAEASRNAFYSQAQVRSKVGQAQRHYSDGRGGRDDDRARTKR
ncbi:hypothetical protein SeMB42_g01606 [Synchytrium endobioticum]|uniref:Peptidyl-prolyl isomerase CWC27 n=1 Tax=Synchytrium endobioticum TaxID=286115 RepID=A0A507DMT3_9FUNG|nr:hypothetical protein SeLEV6574_g00584 [Synchytrium endobioticum]TPX52188.1 hypothetical protein SeMB42_g01611 [Synchytrium endobioticum]TPX52200.1 hypothetical protein SeMB42_g01606 [Synchytrium endobioticum]